FRRFMPCSGLPPKSSVADAVRPSEQTTAYMAAHGCHCIVCSLCFLIVIIEIISFMLHALTRRKLLCIRQDHWFCQEFFLPFRVTGTITHLLPSENPQRNHKADHTPGQQYCYRNPVG